MRFDVMWRGKRYRMPVNDFAIPRMEPGKQRPIQSMEEARGWERLFIGEVNTTLSDSLIRTRDPIFRTVLSCRDFLRWRAWMRAARERCSIGSVTSSIASPIVSVDVSNGPGR
jgi:hypothetical protein